MKCSVLVLGASGYVGSHVVRRLVSAGYEVSGLSRTPEADARIAAAGARPVRGDVAELQALLVAAQGADAVISAAAYTEHESAVTRALVHQMEGTGRTFIYTSGTGVLAELSRGEWSDNRYSEDDAITPPRGAAMRVETENAVREAAPRGVRGIVIRPPMVFGNGGSNQIPMLARVGQRTGAVRYVGKGVNRWSFVHVEDLAELYLRALEAGAGGSLYHAVAGECDRRTLAEAVAEALGLKAASWPWEYAESEQGYGKYWARLVLGSNSRSSGDLTEVRLGWTPAHRDLLKDVAESYRATWMTYGVGA